MSGDAKTYTKGPDSSTMGPSWWDVHQATERLAEKTGERVQLLVRQVLSVSKQRSFALQVVVGERLLMGRGSGFGPGYPNSPRTFPAAALTVLEAAAEWWDEMTPIERAIWLKEGSPVVNA